MHHMDKSSITARIEDLYLKEEQNAALLIQLNEKIDKLYGFFSQDGETLKKAVQRKPRKENDLLDDDELFQRAVSVIEEQGLYRQPDFCFRNLAEALDVTQLRLKKMFSALGRENNLNALLCRQRIKAAVALMNEHPNYSIKAVAEECGFRSMKTFYRWFSKLVGCPPLLHLSTKQPKAL